MKSETSPGAWGFLSGAYFFLLVLVALQLSCAGPQRVGVARQPTERANYALEVRTVCTTMEGITIGGGSATLVAPGQALTAWHVTDCDGAALVMVLSKGRRFRAHVVREWRDHDMAMLRIDDGGMLPAPRIALAPPKLNERVCTQVGYPQPGSSCGQIEMIFPKECPDKQWCRSIMFAAVVIPGNSGGALYNENGELVGVVTGGTFLLGNPLGKAFASDVWSLREEL
jgi:S1-C subfamily serine protease